MEIQLEIIVIPVRISVSHFKRNTNFEYFRFQQYYNMDFTVCDYCSIVLFLLRLTRSIERTD